MKTLFIGLIGLCGIYSIACTNEKQEEKINAIEIKKTIFNQMIGTWVADYDSTKYIESWTSMSDSLFISTGCMLQGTDTLFSESVEIKRNMGKFFYIPAVKDQNNGQAVSFEVNSLTDTSFVAENLKHDFPQRISYTLKGDSVIAFIEGENKDKEIRREYFNMKKKK
ncbi:MAG: DUF6265 family protein [Bacteroidota bacterium]|nr:DUF6265 family protein [Bacteroidota bacterium]